jgi:capsular polysaccharide biosynthesis protein
MESDFVPSFMIKIFARKWWILVAAMVLGGLVGMVITRVHKPVYQSQAVITTAVDYAYSGSLADYELDQLIMGVGEIIDSTKMRQVVVEKVATETSIKAEELLDNMNVIRKGYTWQLTVRAANPTTALETAQIWANESLNALADRRMAAEEAFHIQAAQLALEECLSRVVVMEPASPGCSSQVMDELRGFLEESNNKDGKLTYRNLILLSNLSFELTREPQIATSPVLFRQNLNVLAGALIGLILGLTVLFWRKIQET